MVGVLGQGAVERSGARRGVRAPAGGARPGVGAACNVATGSPTRWGPLVLWLGGLLVGTWFFHTLGDGPLAAPPLDPTGWSGWLAQREALGAAIALLRLVVLASSWYLVGATTIGVVARLARAARLVQVADALTVPFVRRLLRTTLGVSLATAMVASAVPTGSTPSADAPSITRAVLAREFVEVEARPLVTVATSPEAAMHGASGGQPDGTAREPMAPPRRPVPLELLDRTHADARTADRGDGSAAGVGSEGSDSHVVVTGDSLWSIAEATLTDAVGGRPDDRTLARYWREVVAANRGALSDPRNPDLIFPGELVRLPALPS